MANCNIIMMVDKIDFTWQANFLLYYNIIRYVHVYNSNPNPAEGISVADTTNTIYEENSSATGTAVVGDRDPVTGHRFLLS